MDLEPVNQLAAFGTLMLFDFLFDPPGNAYVSHVQGVRNHIGVITDTVDDGFRAELLKFVAGKRLTFITAPDIVALGTV